MLGLPKVPGSASLWRATALVVRWINDVMSSVAKPGSALTASGGYSSLKQVERVVTELVGDVARQLRGSGP